jgi:hypothetical protein
MKISSDKRIAAVVIDCTGEALSGMGNGKDPDETEFQAQCSSLHAAVAGRFLEIEPLAGIVRHLSFKGTTHQLKYYTAPLHGMGAYILYDIDQRKSTMSCAASDIFEECTLVPLAK